MESLGIHFIAEDSAMSEGVGDYYAELRERSETVRREPPSTVDLINRV